MSVTHKEICMIISFFQRICKSGLICKNAPLKSIQSRNMCGEIISTFEEYTSCDS